MRKILVTGLTGHLGKNLAKKLNKYFDTYSLQRKKIFDYENIKEIKCDLGKESKEDIIKKIPKGIDTILYLAQSRNYRNFPEKSKDIFNINIKIPFWLLQYCLKNNIKRFIYTSTGEIKYSTKKKNRNNNFYQCTKFSFEKLISNFDKYLDVSILRLFYLYSNIENNGLVNSLVNKINNDEIITLNGSRNGDLIHITHAEDCANFILFIMRKNISGILDLAPQRRISIRSLSERIAKRINKKVKFFIKKSEMSSETCVSLKKTKKYKSNYKFRSPEEGLKKLNFFRN
ncbi:MAG: hypothetical protein CMK56_03980 [Proteobacteria bacterium]|nr:hypothetical protein [Pseudomonadota bacterium]